MSNKAMYDYIRDNKFDLLEDFISKNASARVQFMRYAESRYIQHIDKEIDEREQWCNNAYKRMRRAEV